MEVSLQFVKLVVNVPNAHCYVYLYISPVVISAFTSREAIEDKLFLRPFPTGTRRLRNF